MTGSKTTVVHASASPPPYSPSRTSRPSGVVPWIEPWRAASGAPRPAGQNSLTSRTGAGPGSTKRTQWSPARSPVDQTAGFPPAPSLRTAPSVSASRRAPAAMASAVTSTPLSRTRLPFSARKVRWNVARWISCTPSSTRTSSFPSMPRRREVTVNVAVRTLSGARAVSIRPPSKSPSQTTRRLRGSFDWLRRFSSMTADGLAETSSWDRTEISSASTTAGRTARTQFQSLVPLCARHCTSSQGFPLRSSSLKKPV